MLNGKVAKIQTKDGGARQTMMISESGARLLLSFDVLAKNRIASLGYWCRENILGICTSLVGS